MNETNQLNLIPQPTSIEIHDGLFTFYNDSKISYQGAGAYQIAQLLQEYLKPATGFDLPIIQNNSSSQIHFQTEETLGVDDSGFSDETYSIEVKSNQIIIKAKSSSGLARGIQCLRQLFPPSIFSSKYIKCEWNISCLKITDSPRFKWRGLHLDVCRHFFTVSEVCRFIELLAQHRYNMCHLHLTEDQGWRIEIKKYPKLTQIGSKREHTLVGHHSRRPRQYDQQEYGGFYTQDDIREIVGFASKRHINIIPEIDMPGHMVAAIAAYPELGNNLNNEVKVRCIWGISQQILNVENKTIEFMKNVLDEIMELFPSKFIHIGGDEAPKHEWSESKRAQERMAELGLKNEHELQSWFIKQMDNHITSKGRRLVGWDEILEGGLAKNATVMSWRGEKGGIEASKLGHDVIMTPQQYVYFDYYQAEPTKDEPLAIGGLTTTENVYNYEPIPKAMDENQEKHVLGTQGQLWTEYIENIKQLEYMTYPRACALAEVSWSDKSKKDYSLFKQKLIIHKERLQIQGVNFFSKD